MWDSSDPERAPPPLPLNPGTSSSPATRTGTSARIEEAAALITARARENAPSAYTVNARPSSPDKNLIRPHHKRMQSIQSSNVSRLSDSLERRSPEKGLTATKLSDYEDYRASRSPERSPTRSGSETPTPSGRVTPSHLNRPILGENTPPSATMLALQSMRNRQESETPLANITNNGPTIGRTPPTFDALSSQILSLTSIATNLQREMAQLSRRSKDNATDLIALKEATNSRDEDIRKSLRDLVSGLDTKFVDQKRLTAPAASRSTPDFSLYLDNQAHSDPAERKSFSLPRIPSPTSFSAAMDRGITNSPTVVTSNGVTNIALLEKVLREMATRDGQDEITKMLENVKRHVESRSEMQSTPKDSPVDPAAMRKLEEILELMKELRDASGSRALVRAGSITNQIGNQERSVQRPSTATETASSFVNEEIMNMLKNVKQSLSQGGGLTNEVKALVRELRGEVLGMGRDIARKLEKVEAAREPTQEPRGLGHDELAEIVQTGLAELKEHMHQIVRENRRQSSGSTRSVVDTQEVVHAVRSALAEMPQPNSTRDPQMDHESLLASIKEAWEDCKPEIALEHFGLERDEILETLKEGLKSYQRQNTDSQVVGATYEDVLEAVQKGMADFRPPPVETEASITREEVMETVRECLENFHFPTQAPATERDRGLDSELTREEILATVREGLSDQAPVTKEIEFNRKDLFAAIKASLEGENNPLGGMGERVLDAMHDFLGNMKSEFQQYSAANGKDTEQVLDALKDGLEDLRADIETYVDRAADVTGKDEIIDTVKSGFAGLQADLDKGFSSQGNSRRNVDTPELLDAMEKEFEHLRDTISKSLLRANTSSDKEEILDAIRDISDDRQSSLSSNTSTEDIVRLVKEELEHMRTTLASTMVRSGGSIDRDEVLDAIREGMEAAQAPRKVDSNESLLSNTSELLDAFQDGVEGIRSDMQKLMDRPVDMSTSYEILDTLKAGLESVRNDIERLHEKQNDLSETSTTRDQQVVIHDENLISTEIEGLKVMITQLRIKVEALDSMPIPQPAMPSETHIHRDDLDELHTAIKEVHLSVNGVRSAQEVPLSSNVASKDDTDAIETLLRNVKAQIEEINLSEFDGTAKTTHLDSVEDMLRDMKATLDDSIIRAEVNAVSKEDFTMVELLLKEVSSGVDELQAKMKAMPAHEDSVSKADINAIEALCLDTKTQIDELAIPHPDSLPTKEEVASIKESLTTMQEQIEANSELTGQAFEARKTEHGGLANKLEDVQAVLGDLRDELIEKLEGPADGIVELHKLLEAHHDSMGAYATAANMTQLSELVNREFERHMDHHVQTKSEAEDRDSTLLAKHDEVKAELRSKIEDKFDELMTKYDDAQLANDAKLGALESRDSEHLDATTSTKAVVEDMKVLVDALGTTVSETCDRLVDDLKTVFVRVDETNNKVGEVFTSNAHEHGMTREEVGKTLATALRLEGTLGEQQPAMMAGIREILGLIGQHYEHSQRQAEDFARATEEIKSGMDGIPSSIQPLLPAPVESPPLLPEVPAPKEYDDSQVHDKLNNLISHAAVAREAFASIDAHHQTTHDKLAGMEKLEKLDQIDKIHDQVLATAAELSAMVATQTQLMHDHHESRAAEATQAEIALEKRTAQKEKVEADIVGLTAEKEALVESMAELRREHEQLMGDTKRLTREVAKLETALNIRTEEMRDMNAKAESLERRILEGVMNHARSVHISKPSKKTRITPAERDASMSLKRVPSSASTVTTKTSVNNGSTIGSAVGMALKKRTPLSSGQSTVSSRASVDRRILSTSNVSGNRGRDPPQRALMLAPAPNSTGLVNLKRSHSVKSNPSSYYGGRKASWTGNAPSVADKENEVLDETHEDDHDSDGATSETGTERRTSYTGTYTDSLAYGTGSSLSTHGTRTASYASSIAGAIGPNTESIEEEEEPEELEAESSNEHESNQEDESAKIMALLEAPPSSVNAGQDNSMAMTTFDELDMANPMADDMSDLEPPRLLTDPAKYDHASDSGIGTEPLTADEGHHGEAQEYFEMSRHDIDIAAAGD